MLSYKNSDAASDLMGVTLLSYDAVQAVMILFG
jgi:hypothetical protein